jgi:hypothetical protein
MSPCTAGRPRRRADTFVAWAGFVTEKKLTAENAKDAEVRSFHFNLCGLGVLGGENVFEEKIRS